MCVCVFVGAFVCLSVCLFAIRILYRCVFSVCMYASRIL